jgi:uncharacterized membrane protein YkvA (DUF1232 family)
MPVDHAAAGDATWEGLDERTARQAARDEARVRRGFWSKVKRVAARLPFAEDLLSAYYCAFDRTTPIQVKAALLGALAYFVLPVDLVPDILPVLGYADDAAVLATALRLVASHIRPEHREAARQALARGLDQ